jgi:cytochrome P450
MKLSDEERDRQIHERALYFSRHRELEGREADPLNDWLNSEWVQNNQATYDEMFAATQAQIRKLVGQDPTDETLLPTSDAELEKLGSALKGEMSTIDVASALRQSKTFIGLVEALVTQARTALSQ